MDLYKTLGLDYNLRNNITKNDIKKAYRKLAKKYHPDKNSSVKSPEEFIKLNHAYNTLLNQTNDNRTVKNEELTKTWEKDIILKTKIKSNKFVVKFFRQEHLIVLGFVFFIRKKISLNVELPLDFDYNNDLYTIDKQGNDVIIEGQIVRGDLDLDISYDN
jgi:hypothetical protein